MEIQVFFLTLCSCIIPCHPQWPGIFNRGRARKRPPIDGHWSPWESWSSCYKNTETPPSSLPYFKPWDGFNVRTRNRTCTNPRPLFGGRDCDPPDHRFKQCSCSNPLLGQSRLDSSHLSSSSFLPGYPPGEVRLSNTTSVGWCAQEKPSFFTETYLQIDFQNFVTVGAISTISNAKGRVYRYKLKYSLDGTVWKPIRKDKKTVFTGNYFPNKLQKNTFSSRVMRYLRLVTVSHFEKPCLKVEVFGCLHTCGQRLTAPFGELVAQSSQLHDQDCLWKVDVVNTTSLAFSFSMFYVMCRDGYVSFYSGHAQFSKAKLLKQVCLQEGSSGIPKLLLELKSVWVRFVSNSSEEEVSFNIKYFSKCTQVIHLKGGEPVHVTSPNYPRHYVNNLNCSWEIIPPPLSNKIEITPNQFSVEGGSPNGHCTSDVVNIDTDQNVNVGSFCNDNKPKNLVIVARKVVITFRTDSIVTDKGFEFTIKSGSRSPDLQAATNGNRQTIGAVVGQETDESRKVDPDMQSGGHFNSTGKRKIKPEKDETWTVIVICTFSALVIVLIGTVMYMNCKRWMDNRNELNAQCRKVAAEEKRKGKTKSNERNVLIISKTDERYTRPPEHQVMLNTMANRGSERGSQGEETPEIQPTELLEEPASESGTSTMVSDSPPLPDVDTDVADADGESSGSELLTSSIPESVVINPNSSSCDGQESIM